MNLNNITTDDGIERMNRIIQNIRADVHDPHYLEKINQEFDKGADYNELNQRIKVMKKKLELDIERMNNGSN